MGLKIHHCLLVLLCLSLVSSKLLFVAEVYRHGARGALSPFYDGHNQTDIAGQLTATGQRQHYNLGKQLREEYITKLKFLPEKYNHTLINVRSDDYDRTIMSAISHFQGMYPDSFGATLPKDLPHKYTLPPFEQMESEEDYYNSMDEEDFGPENYAFPHGIQVLPVHVASLNEDYIFSSDDLCLNFKLFSADHVAKNLKVSEWVDDKMGETYLTLSTVFKQPVVGWLPTEGLHDVVTADYFNGRKVPAFPEKTHKAFEFLDDFYWLFMQSGSIRAVRLVTTPIMKNIFESFDAAINQSSSLLWSSFSGHDSNLTPIMRLLNFTDYQCLIDNYFYQNSTALNCVHRPGFAASIIFELHSGDDETQNEEASSQYIRVRYNGEYMNLCEKNSTYCDYNEFKNRIEINYPVNFAKECLNTKVFSEIQQSAQVNVNMDSQDINNNGNSSNLIMLFLAAQVGIIVLAYLVLSKKIKKINDSKYENNQIIDNSMTQGLQAC